MCKLPGFFPSDPQLLLCHRMMHASLRSIAVAFLSCQFVGGFSHVIGTPRNYLGPQLVVKWRHGLHGGQATIGGFQADYIAKTMSQSLRVRQVRAPSVLHPSPFISVDGSARGNIFHAIELDGDMICELHVRYGVVTGEECFVGVRSQALGRTTGWCLEAKGT